MWPIPTDMVAWSVSLSDMTVSSAKVAEPIEMPFGMLTRVGPRNHLPNGDQISPCEGAIVKAKMAGPGHVWMCGARYTQRHMVGMPTWVY